MSIHRRIIQQIALLTFLYHPHQYLYQHLPMTTKQSVVRRLVNVVVLKVDAAFNSTKLFKM